MAYRIEDEEERDTRCLLTDPESTMAAPRMRPADGDGHDALMRETGDIGRSRGLEDVLCEGDDGEESETEAAGGGSRKKHLHHDPSLIDELTPDGGRLENCSKEMDERDNDEKEGKYNYD